MTTKKLCGLAATMTLSLFASAAGAQVPETLSYSGHLSDDGVPANDDVTLTFGLFSDATGGTPLWTETHPSVPVAAGRFSVQLGAQTPVMDAFGGATALFLQVTVDGEAMLPRTRVGSMPYAFHADRLGGMTAEEIIASASGGSGVQAILDELTARLDALESASSTHQVALDANTAAIATLQVDDDELLALLSTNTGAIAANTSDIASVQTTASSNTSAANANASAIGSLQASVDDRVTNAELSTALSSYATAASTNGLDTRLSTAEGDLSSLTSRVSDAEADIDAVQSKTASMSADPTNVFFTGVNVHIRNGLGATNGNPTNPQSTTSVAVNGVGNLVIGYDEARSSGSSKTGSHNIVSGIENNYTSFGGMVLGRLNNSLAPYGSISAGYDNTVIASYGSVSGGREGSASGSYSAVSGGFKNEASGTYSAVSGGNQNDATGLNSWVSGGVGNEAAGSYSAVSGGNSNTASGNDSSISGGQGQSVSGFYDWRGGSMYFSDD